jgi:hypothetical protein
MEEICNGQAGIVVGVDNGLSGALVAISQLDGSYIGGFAMPTLKSGKFNTIDGAAVVAWIRNVAGDRKLTVAIEACPEHAKQKSIMRSMAISYGILFGSVTVGLPTADLRIVRSGNPKDSADSEKTKTSLRRWHLRASFGRKRNLREHPSAG